jgi:hypothetical protein
MVFMIFFGKMNIPIQYTCMLLKANDKKTTFFSQRRVFFDSHEFCPRVLSNLHHLNFLKSKELPSSLDNQFTAISLAEIHLNNKTYSYLEHRFNGIN